MTSLGRGWCLASLLVAGGCASAPPLPPVAAPASLPEAGSLPSLCTPGPTPCRAQLAELAARSPGRGDALRELGWLDYLDGDRVHARDELGRALKVNPADPRVLLGLGLLDDEEDHAESARDLWLRILELRTAPGTSDADPWRVPCQLEAAVRLLRSIGEVPGEEAVARRLDALDETRLPGEARDRVAAARARLLRRRGDESAAARLDAAHGCPLVVATFGPYGHLPTLELERAFPADERDPASLGRGESAALARGRGCFFQVVTPQGRPGVAYAVFYARAERPLTTRLRVATDRPFHVLVDGQTVYRQAPADGWPPGSVQLALALSPGLHRVAIKLSALDSRVPVALRLQPAPGLTIVDDAFGEKPVAPRADLGSASRAEVRAQVVIDPGIPAPAAAEQPRLALWLAGRRALVAGDGEAAAALVARLDKEAPRFVPALLLGTEVDLADPSRPRRLSRDRARRRLERVLSLDPACLAARTQLVEQDLEEDHADRAVRRVAGAPPSESWRLAYAAYRALRARDWDVEAEKALAEARRLDAEACPPVEAEVEVALRRHDRKRALAAARSLVQCDPESSQLADLLKREGGDAAAAATEYRRLLALDPARQSALRGLGEALSATGDARGAAEVWGRLVALEPRVAAWRRHLADALLGTGDEEGARRAVLDGLASAPEAQELHRALAALGGTRGGPGVMDPFRLDGRKVIADFEAEGRRYETPAVIVLDRTVTRVFPTGARLTMTHNIMRVQTKDGIDKFGEVAIPEGADVLLLRAVKADGGTREAQEIGNKRSVSVPDLAPGDYVEFEYIEPSGPPAAFPGGFYTERFFFQSFDAPLDRTEYVLAMPAGMALQVDRRGDAPVDKVESIDDPLGTGARLDVHTWADRHKAQLLPEPQQAPMTEHVPSVRVGSAITFAGWRDFLADQQYGTLRANRELRELARGLGSPEAIDQWVRRHIKQGGSLDEVATSVLAKGEGSRVVLERALLAALGVKAELWLVRSRLDAQLDGPLPDLEGFDEPLLAIPPADPTTPGKAPLVIDPRFRHTPTGFIAPPLRGGKAFSLGEPLSPEARFVTVPEGLGERGAAARDVKLEATLLPDGSADVSVEETLTGWPALEWREGLERIDAERIRAEFEQRTIGFYFPGGTLQALDFGPAADDDKPFVVRYRVHAPRFARDEGDRLVIPAPFPAMLSRRYVGVAERRTALQLAYAPRNAIDCTIRLPAGARAATSAPVTLDGFGEFKQEVSVEPGVVRLRGTFALPPDRVPAGRYPEFVRWAESLDRAEARAAVVDLK